MAVAINLPIFQNFITQKVITYLSERLDTKISIDQVSLSLLNRIDIEGVYIEDRNQDTLLYAGAISGKITDWFIFKESSTISYVRLKDAVVNLKRDNYGLPWNYQFIVDEFASKDSSNTKKKSFPKIDLKEVLLQNVNFYKQEDTFGDNSRFVVAHLNIQAEKIDIVNKQIFIDEVDVEGLEYLISKNTNWTGINPPKPYVKPSTANKTPFNPNGFDIRVKKINVEDGTFALHTINFPVRTDQFDPRHIHLQDIQVAVRDVIIHNDTLRGRIDHLQSKDRSGMEIRKMYGDVKVNPNISEVKNMYLETNRSVLRDYYAMHYKHFPAFNNYIEEVTMETHISNSYIAMEDIAFFAPALMRWKGKGYNGGFSGYGPITHLDIKNINLSDANLHFTGDYEMKGLPDINTTTLKYTNGTIRTHYNELIDLFPEIKKLDLAPLANVKDIAFDGNVNGLYNNLNIDGKIQTNAGTIISQALHLDYAGDHFNYDGKLQSDNLNLEALFPDATLGNTAFDVALKGDGFNYRTNQIQANGTIHQFLYNDYNYKDVSFDVKAKDGQVKADIKSQDPNANVDLVTVITDVAQKPVYKIDGIIHWIDFQKLGLVENSFSGRGIVDASISGTNFKNIEGTAKLQNMVLASGPDTLNYYDFEFSSYRDGLKNNVSFTTNNLKANVDGTFYIDDLAKSIQRYLSHYMSGFIPPISRDIPQQEFSFEIQADEPDKLISVFMPQLKISNGLHIAGYLNESIQELELQGKIPFIQYRNLKAENISILSSGDITKLNLAIHASRFTTNDKEMIADFDYFSSVTDNNIQFDINTTSSNTFGTANINGTAQTLNDSFVLKLNPSELFFNNQKWDIAGGNTIAFANNYMDIDNLIINSDQQLLKINSPDIPNRTLGVINAQIQKINVPPILAMVGLEDIAVEGLLNGDIHIEGLPQKMDADFNLKGAQWTTKGKLMGDLVLKGNYDVMESALQLDLPSGMYDKDGKISLMGTLITDSAKNNKVDFRAEGMGGNLAWAEPFAAELIKDLEGSVDGYINIKGQFPKPEIDGKVNIHQAHFTPLITGAEYLIPESEIVITSKLFDIKEAEIYDKEANKGVLSGTIAHQYFANLDFALRMVSEKIIVLDKEVSKDKKDNFYGKVYAGVNLTLRGLLRDLNMNITARTAANSKLYIPLADNSDLQQYEYITFKKNVATTEEKKIEKKTRLTVNLDAIVNPELEAEIIIDPTAGDLINARGTGNLAMSIPSEGDIRLNGSYNIESGYYDFTFNQLQLLVYKNRFNLLQGSVINWDGKVSDATVDVKANTLKRARLYDLIVDDVMRGAVVMDNSSAERSDALTPQNIVIGMNMTGKLMSPDLKFKLDLEETRSIGTYAYQKMQRINQDERDLVNQVVGLLVLNQFMPMDGINSTVAVNTGVSNIADIFSTFASSQITNFTNKVLGIEDLWVNLKYKNYNLSEVEMANNSLNYLNRNEAGISVRKNFFNDRLVVDIGGVYDWGRGSYTSGGAVTDNLTGDFRLAYLLSPDGRLRMNIFRTSSFDAISLQNIGRHGVGFTYRKNFSNFYDLFGIKQGNSVLATPKPLGIIATDTIPKKDSTFEKMSIPKDDSSI